LLSADEQILVSDLALPNLQHRPVLPTENTDAQMTLDDAEKAILLNALEQARNNVSQAARQLGITRMTMRYRMDKHGISV
jgi:transcriptional regulator of acetoin/glycerol metabolism